MKIQKYERKQNEQMRLLPFEEDMPQICLGDYAVGFFVAAFFLALVLGIIA